MRNSRTAAALTAVATAALISSGSIASASPAGASTATALTAYLTCSGSGGAFDCTLSINGGTAPYSTAWGGTNVAYDYTSTYQAGGYCLSVSASPKATVKDSAGHLTTTAKTVYCNA